jgi:hypothetical protein
MKQFYDLQHLNTFYDIEPSEYVGEQLVDAGRITFKDKVHVDVSHSMGFKNDEMYCVAPVVSPKTQKDSIYDIWVVGKNCCSGIQADFHCDGYLDVRNMGGFRLMNDGDRPFYRLAVQQAEATYKIRTRKPLFFTWQFDPISFTNNLQTTGFHNYYFGVFTALVVQMFSVTLATLVWAKEMPSRPHMHHRGPGRYEKAVLP